MLSIFIQQSQSIFGYKIDVQHTIGCLKYLVNVITFYFVGQPDTCKWLAICVLTAVHINFGFFCQGAAHGECHVDFFIQV